MARALALQARGHRFESDILHDEGGPTGRPIGKGQGKAERKRRHRSGSSPTLPPFRDGGHRPGKYSGHHVYTAGAAAGQARGKVH